MPRLLPFIHALIPVLATACQATVNVTEATDTDNASEGGSADDDTAAETGMCSPGDVGCACYGNNTCNGDFVCTVNVCEPPAGSTETTTGKTTDTPDDTGPDTVGDTTEPPGDTSNGTTADPASSSSGDDTGGSGDDTGGNAGCTDVPADMVCVPADAFEMGTSLNVVHTQMTDPQEKPAHMVTLTKTYWIDKYEVTVGDYALCWASQVCELPVMGQGYNWGVMNKEKHPINGVNWYQAKTYCEWKGKRLPTEAEWELAARGTDGRLYPWGDDKPTCELTVSDSCGTSGTMEVGSRPLGVSPYGAFDMSGNVVEWCADYYKVDYYYDSPAVDPTGPMAGTSRSARSFMPPLYDIDWAAIVGRATYRAGYSPLLQDVNPAVLGIRCAQTAP